MPVTPDAAYEEQHRSDQVQQCKRGERTSPEGRPQLAGEDAAERETRE